MVDVDASTLAAGASGGAGNGGGGFGGGGAVAGSGIGGSGTGGVGAAGASGASGTGGGQPYCTGAATPCGQLVAGQCPTAQGCKVKGTCVGSANFCSSLHSSYSCISQQGCVWSSYNQKCSGFAWSCDLFSSSTTCINQLYCAWDLGCEGTATPCTELSEATCELQPGCQLVYP